MATQYAHDVVLTSVRRRFKVMDVAWTSKQRRVLTGQCYHIQFVLLLQSIQHRIVFYWKKQ